MLFIEILTDEQKQLLPLVKHFAKDFYLVGGTALALQIGHRRSIDFDLFTAKHIPRLFIKKYFSKKFPSKVKFSYEADDQMHLRINGVKITFFRFPYTLSGFVNFNNIFKMAGLPEIAAMKAFAFAERAKWKDYVDMYFLLKNHLTLSEICRRTEELFNTATSVVFTEKLFRQQLCFFKDIDFSEPVEFIGDAVSEEEIKQFLTDVSVTPFFM